jgi:sirohydrochlorin cobaltochelatase
LNESPLPETTHVILVGHGAPPSDAPRELVRRLKALEGLRGASGAPPTAEERELDATLRRWPRTAQTDPYRAGLEALAAALAPKVAPARVSVAYNELCAPSVEEAIEAAIDAGAREVRLVTTMLTPGGVHAAREIPEAIARLRAAWPAIPIAYAWPPPLDEVASLFASLARGAGER